MYITQIHSICFLDQKSRGLNAFPIISHFFLRKIKWGFPGGSVVKNPPANAEDARDAGSIPDLGRSSGGGNGNLLQYSCLENFMGREAWRATVHGVAKSWTWLSDWAQHAYSLHELYWILAESERMQNWWWFWFCCVCLSSETKRLHDLPKLTQKAMLPEMKFRIPDTQEAVDY